jgi:hypothetical protein
MTPDFVDGFQLCGKIMLVIAAALFVGYIALQRITTAPGLGQPSCQGESVPFTAGGRAAPPPPHRC